MALDKQILFGKEDLGRFVSRMAHEIVESVDDPRELVMIGIRSRGVHLARRIARKIGELSKGPPPIGVLDVTPFRDDRVRSGRLPPQSPFEGPVDVDEKTVVLVDDVIYRGRTIRAAMEAVAGMGHAKRLLVAVLVDRGARELPIRADIVGKNIDAGEGNRVNVLLEESDGIDQITLTPWVPRDRDAGGTD